MSKKEEPKGGDVGYFYGPKEMAEMTEAGVGECPPRPGHCGADSRGRAMSDNTTPVAANYSERDTLLLAMPVALALREDEEEDEEVRQQRTDIAKLREERDEAQKEAANCRAIAKENADTCIKISKDFGAFKACHDEWKARAEKAEAEAAELREDKARLDFVIERMSLGAFAALSEYPEEARVAIDAARKAEK